MQASSLIAVTSTPTSPYEVWDMAYLPLPNWAGGVRVTNQFTTDIVHALTTDEHRWGLRGKPLRSISVDLQAWTPSDLKRLHSWCLRAQKARFLMPLHCDQSRVTATASGTSVPCDTTYRRFCIGGRVVIYRALGEIFADTFEVATIQSIAAGALTLTGSLSQSFPAGSLVCPLIETRLMPSLNGMVLSDHVNTLTIEAIEATGSSQLDLVQEMDSTPSGFAEYDGYPILHLPPDFSQEQGWGFAAEIEEQESGISTVETVYGDRGKATFNLSLRGMSRSEAWDILKFFESRGGRLYPFWLPSPSTALNVQVVDPNTLSVEAAGPEEDWSHYPHLAVQAPDGSYSIHAVADVTREYGTDTVTLTEAIPGDVRRVCPAQLCRFANDDMPEFWHSDGVMDANLSIIELLTEQEVEAANINRPVTTPLAYPFSLGQCEGTVFIFSIRSASGSGMTGSDPNIWIVNTRNNTVIASASIGGSTDNFASFAYDTETGYVFLCQVYPDNSPELAQIWKLDNALDILWQRAVPTGSAEDAWNIVQSGNFLYTCQTHTIRSPGANVCKFRKSDGSSVWEKRIGTTAGIFTSSINHFAGRPWAALSNGNNCTLVKFDENGDTNLSASSQHPITARQILPGLANDFFVAGSGGIARYSQDDLSLLTENYIHTAGYASSLRQLPDGTLISLWDSSLDTPSTNLKAFDPTNLTTPIWSIPSPDANALEVVNTDIYQASIKSSVAYAAEIYRRTAADSYASKELVFTSPLVTYPSGNFVGRLQRITTPIV